MRRVIWGVVIAAGLAMPAMSQTPPRASDGHPDFSGVWVYPYLTSLERPDGAKDLIVSPDKAAEVAKSLAHVEMGPDDPDSQLFQATELMPLNGELRSSWITTGDGRLPLTALGKLSAAKRSARTFDNPEERPGSERCVDGLGHAPITAASIIIPTQIIQMPHALLMQTEDIDPVRIVHLVGEPPPDVIRTRQGWSQGRWEGDTLVIETTHFAAKDPTGVLFRDSMQISEAGRVIERFAFLTPDDLLYRFTVVDPALYSAPWSAEYVLKRTNDRLYEYACHEGNLALTNILTAARLGRQKTPARPVQ